jgi:hypothetical protein
MALFPEEGGGLSVATGVQMACLRGATRCAPNSEQGIMAEGQCGVLLYRTVNGDSVVLRARVVISER